MWSYVGQLKLNVDEIDLSVQLKPILLRRFTSTILEVNIKSFFLLIRILIFMEI